MKQLNHSPEAAAAVLKISLSAAQELMTRRRRKIGVSRSPFPQRQLWPAALANVLHL